jgi:hypothetical protein
MKKSISGLSQKFLDNKEAFGLIPALTDPDNLYSGEPPFVARVVVVYVPPVAAARRTCANAVQNSLAISNLNVHGYTELP